MTVRVLLVDDQDLVRSGLRRILRRKIGFEVVAECADGAGVEVAVASHQPDLVVMDLRMKVVDGIEATRRLRTRGDDPPVLVLTTFDDDELLSGALRAGAAGFVLKDAPAEELIQAAHVVARGEAWLDPAVTGRVLSTYRRAAAAPTADAPAPHHDLTRRELEVLRLVGRGLSNAQLAATLYISELTVKSHIGHIFAKLGLRDRVAAVIYAFDHGIVTPGEAADTATGPRP
jgi:DNA-binding NarL/FixJ family response regulator